MRLIRLLGIETADFFGSVALVEDGRVVAECALNGGKGGHSRWLLPAIEWLLEGAGWTPDTLTALAVNRGPGSFTGIRIGLATAQGLAYGWDKPLRGVEGLAALAWQAVAPASSVLGEQTDPTPLTSADTIVLSLIDARHGNVYAAAYRYDPSDSRVLQPLVDPAAWAMEDFLDAVEERVHLSQTYLHLAGDGGVLFESMIQRRFQHVAHVVPVCLAGERLRASTVARWAARHHDPVASGEQAGVWPLYLKKSEAERQWRQPTNR